MGSEAAPEGERPPARVTAAEASAAAPVWPVRVDVTAPPGDPRSLLAVQRHAGNRATCELVRRQQAPSITRSPVSVQRDWQPSGKEGVSVWSEPRAGLKWYFNHATGKLYYATTMLAKGQNKEHTASLQAYAGTEHTLEEWQSYGWLEEPLPATPGAAAGSGPKAASESKEPRNFAGITLGAEQEIRTKYKVELGKKVTKGGKLGSITKDGKELVEFETDMNMAGTKIYTLELKTTPCEQNDKQGWTDRLGAMKLVLGQIAKAAEEKGADGQGGAAIKPITSEGFELKVQVNDHRILHTQPTLGVSFSNQITMGVSNEDILAMNDDVIGPILRQATWYDPQHFQALRNAFATRHAKPPPGQDATTIPTAANAYALLTSVNIRLAGILDSMVVQQQLLQRVQPEDVERKQGETDQDLAKREAEAQEKLAVDTGVVSPEGEVAGDISAQEQKNKWGVLPKTAPITWLSSLPAPWKSLIIAEIQKPPPEFKGRANCYAAAQRWIREGRDIGAHKIPPFKIGGKMGSAFEFRTVEHGTFTENLYKDQPAGGSSVFDAVSPDRINGALSDLAQMGVNDSGKVDTAKLKHDEVNCALVTIGAIIGKQSSAASTEVQKALGQRTDGQINKAIQSHNLWAMQLLPSNIEPLVALKLVEKINDPMFPEGNAYIVGDAQFSGMLKFLSQNMPPLPGGAGAGGGAQPTWKLFQKGEPGQEMYASDALVAAMKAFPDGTRFACFMLDPGFGGGTGGHWVYAENKGGSVTFVDFQKNAASLAKGKAKPAVGALDAFPFVDHKNERKGRFAEGMFIAVAPVADDFVPPSGAKVVDMGEVDQVLAEAKLRFETLRDTRRIDEAPSAYPEGLFAEDPSVIQIPSPSAVDAAIKDVLSSLGVGARESRLGRNAKGWSIYIAGHPRIEAGAVVVPNLADRAELVGGDGKLADFDKLVEDETVQGAVTKARELSAEAKGDYIWVNAARFEFTDVIHEVLHTYEPNGKSFSVPMAEGMTEVLAEMVGKKLVERTKDPRFNYRFSTFYNPHRLRVENLIAVFGMRPMMELFYGDGTLIDQLVSLIEKRGKRKDEATVLATKLTSPKHEDIDAALQAIIGTAPLPHGEEALDTARTESDAASSKGEEDRLLTLYKKLADSRGETYLALARTIGQIEHNMAKARGTTARAIRKELGGVVEVTFEVYGPGPVWISGPSGELGGGESGRALPTRSAEGAWVTAPVDFLLQRNKVIKVEVLTGADRKSKATHLVKIPDTDTAVLTFMGTTTDLAQGQKTSGQTVDAKQPAHV